MWGIISCGVGQSAHCSGDTFMAPHVRSGCMARIVNTVSPSPLLLHSAQRCIALYCLVVENCVCVWVCFVLIYFPFVVIYCFLIRKVAIAFHHSKHLIGQVLTVSFHSFCRRIKVRSSSIGFLR